MPYAFIDCIGTILSSRKKTSKPHSGYLSHVAINKYWSGFRFSSRGHRMFLNIESLESHLSFPNNCIDSHSQLFSSLSSSPCSPSLPPSWSGSDSSGVVASSLPPSSSLLHPPSSLPCYLELGASSNSALLWCRPLLQQSLQHTKTVLIGILLVLFCFWRVAISHN